MKTLAALTGLLALAAPALASSSGTVTGEGTSLRLVSAGPAKADGRIDAVLEITLEPGWKTYWIDPGEAGVPPSLTLGSGEALPLRLPAPKIIDEGDMKLVGYDGSVRFVTSLPAGAPAQVEAFIGVCEKICVPVGGTLTLDPAADPDNADDASVMAEALDALPPPAAAGFSARAAALNADSLSVAATVPADAAEALLFVASAEGHILGTAAPATPSGGQAAFTVPLVRDGDAPWPADGFYYVLSAGGRSVEGRLPPP